MTIMMGAHVDGDDVYVSRNYSLLGVGPGSMRPVIEVSMHMG